MSNFEERVRDYAEATQVFLDALSLVTDTTIDAHEPNGWSARQIIHHVADSETQSYARLRRLLAEPTGSLIQGYDEAAWAEASELGYRTLPIDHSVAVFTAVRASSLVILRRLNETHVTRSGIHSESGAYTLDDWLSIYTAHPREHADQLREALASGR